MSMAYQNIHALLRLASHGVDTISNDASPNAKALKAAAKSALVDIARELATAPKDRLNGLYYLKYYSERLIYELTSDNDYLNDDEDRAFTLFVLVTEILRSGLTKRGDIRDPREEPFINLFAELATPPEV